MNADAIYEPVVTRLPEALQEEAEAIAEAEAAQRKAEADKAAQAVQAADAAEAARAAAEAKGYAEDEARLKRESEQQLDKEYALERVRASSEELRAARRNLWETAKIARGFGLTLAEIAHESGFAIETVRRKLGESATPAREMMP